MVAVDDALLQLIAPERECQPGPLKFVDESSGNVRTDGGYRPRNRAGIPVLRWSPMSSSS